MISDSTAMPTFDYSLPNLTRDDCLQLDQADPLSSCRERFLLPEGLIYLDGMSLGPLPKRSASSLRNVTERQWGEGLIRSWNTADWIDAPIRVGAKLAPLLGAEPDELIVADSTSVNLFKLLIAALRVCPERKVILTTDDNFPTNVHVADGVQQLLPDVSLRVVPADQIDSAIAEDVAVVAMSHVDYKTARINDAERITRQAHRQGALVLFDLSHSAGAVPVELNAWQADLAVGCGYKYLNGGPGAPAYLFVARRHQSPFRQPITGWMGHAEPFQFEVEYRPAEGIRRALTGTPPILSLAGLEAALEVWWGVELAMIRKKSRALGSLFVRLVEQWASTPELSLGSPSDPEHRGGHLSFHHPEGYAVMQALIARGIIGDFRAPDQMRFGLAPLYLRFVDVWDAAAALAEIVNERSWDQPQFKRREKVT